MVLKPKLHQHQDFSKSVWKIKKSRPYFPSYDQRKHQENRDWWTICLKAVVPDSSTNTRRVLKPEWK